MYGAVAPIKEVTITTPRTQKQSSARIVIVNDDRETGELYAKELNQEGFHAEAFSDPTLALSNLRKRKYDVAVLDMQMSKTSGFELYRKMSEIDQKMRCCFLSEFEIGQDAFKSMLFPFGGAKTVLAKPVSVSQLATTVSELLKQEHSE